MKKAILYRISLLLALPVALLISGCESQPSARVIDSQGTQTITTLNQIDIQDWNRAADKLVADLLSSGVLERAPQQPAVMAISRVVNNTASQVDTDLLTRRIRIALNQSGKVLTTTTMAYGGRVDDPLAAEAAQLQAFRSGERQETMIPHYTLSGRLSQIDARDGRTRQVTYVFRLALTTVADGLAVWEGEDQITKQGTRASVGW